MDITLLFIPAPSADQFVPFQWAAKFAEVAPAEVKDPPTKTAPCRVTARAFTELFTPLPNADQPLPSHLATWLAGK